MVGKAVRRRDVPLQHFRRKAFIAFHVEGGEIERIGVVIFPR
jgi:hypothetical protein